MNQQIYALGTAKELNILEIIRKALCLDFAFDSDQLRKKAKTIERFAPLCFLKWVRSVGTILILLKFCLVLIPSFIIRNCPSRHNISE